jgi:hypothetical protein
MSARRRAALLLWLPIAGVALGDRTLGTPWLHVADVACGLFLLGCALALRAPLARLRLAPWAPALGLFVAAGLLSGAAAYATGAPGFVPLEFARSAARLGFAAALALALDATLALAGSGAGVRVARDAFALAALVGLTLYALVLAGAPLPHELVCGQDRVTCSAYYYERRWFGDASPESLRHDVFLRAQGLAAEPTRFGYLLAMALGLLLLRRPLEPQPDARHALVALGAVASFALAPYALLLLVAALAGWRLARAGAPALRRRVALGVLALSLIVALSPLGSTLHRTVVVRVQKMAAGGLDSSAFLRVAGGWIMAGRLAAERPLTGVGLGQFDLGVEALRARLPAAHLLGGSIQSWNALTYVLGTTGLLGLGAFLHLLWRALRQRPAAAAVFALGLFADGTVLGPAFWVFLALYAQEQEKPGEQERRASRKTP